MSNRDADATIKGFYYQFDKTILQILEANDDDTFVVEHIEDISVYTPHETKAIQCKYVPSKNFNNSTIREAVIQMLDDYRTRLSTSPPINYRLYAYYATVPTQQTLSLHDLKEILTFTKDRNQIVYHVEHGITDKILTEFLTRFTFEHGLEFYVQQAGAIDALRIHFSCHPTEAEYLYYNNALQRVLDLCTRPTESERTFTRKDFLSRINVRVPLFNIWYIEMKGYAAYKKVVLERIGSTHALQGVKNRYIFLDGSYLACSSGSLSVPDFIQNVVSDFYPLGKVFYNHLPLTFVINTSDTAMLVIKRELIRLGISFNDGYEYIEFSESIFNAPPIINLQKLGKRTTERVEKASYHVRVISAATLLRSKHIIEPPHTALCFSDGSPASRDNHLAYFQDRRTLVMTVHARTLEDAASILNRR